MTLSHNSQPISHWCHVSFNQLTLPPFLCFSSYVLKSLSTAQFCNQRLQTKSNYKVWTELQRHLVNVTPKKKKTKKQNQEKQLRSSSRALGVRELKSSPAPYFFLSLSKERPLNSPIALPPFLVGTVLFRCFQSVCPHQSSIPQCLTDVPLLQIQKDITEKTRKGRTAKKRDRLLPTLAFSLHKWNLRNMLHASLS